ncbi:putative SOS response-associated peptidase [uncultured Defluviicoccus sp.]|uniref:Putative SOS response-associated peptidase n=1 Tax=metagenome TaxID=256318 RepID=A0A380TL27_9ZZZZ|nr:putative SOS response-associated peptidase [uncultured Defluviicoccus sp.]
MCGRFSQLRAWSELVRLYRVTASQTPLKLPPRYNIAPTQDVPVVRRTREGDERELVTMRWGLVPFWARDLKGGAKMINARAETIAERPAFRDAFQRRRCLVAADGFYEWEKTQAGKQPCRITVADCRPFAFAGLWERWRSSEGEAIESFTIIVTAANEQVRPLHDRMPMMLDVGQFGPWLDGGSGIKQLHALLRPYAGELTIRAVSTRVNSVANDDPGCIEPI